MGSKKLNENKSLRAGMECFAHLEYSKSENNNLIFNGFLEQIDKN